MNFFSGAVSCSSSLLLLLLLGYSGTLRMVTGQPEEPLGVIELDAATFKQYIDDPTKLDVIVDVRSFAEWQTGHIEGATLVENLASLGATPADLAGCEYCNIAVYCRSGNRARLALTKLIAAGFRGRLYNGLGTFQWTNAGYPLVNTPSVIPPCTVDADVSEQCRLAYLAYTGGSESTACQNAATCNDCLNMGCAWAEIEQCLDSCSDIADVGCYSSEYFQGTPGQICAVAAVDKRDRELCQGIDSDCATCTSTLKTDGKSTCEWYKEGTTDAWCDTGGCNLLGNCGSAECSSAPVPASPPVGIWGPTTWGSDRPPVAPPVATAPVASPVATAPVAPPVATTPVDSPVRIWGPTTWSAAYPADTVPKASAPASMPINYSWVSNSWDSSATPPVGTSGGGGGDDGGSDGATPLSDTTAATEDKSGTYSCHSNSFLLRATASFLLAWMNVLLL